MTRRLLINSNAPWTPSGYGNQVAIFAPKFRDAGYDVALSCFYGLEGGMINWGGFNCYPADNSRFGAHRIHEMAAHHGQGDPLNTTVFTLQDVWTLGWNNPFFEEIKKLRWACWTPVDHDPCPAMVTHFLRESAAQVIALSRHGQKAFEKEGIEADYVPHGIDTSLFAPRPELKREYRQALSIPEDAFVVGMVANNQGIPSRKAFPQAFEAYKRFADKHSDAVLYIHGDLLGRNQGLHLIRLAAAVGIDPDRVFASDQTGLYLGTSQSFMANMFNTFDVLLMPSLGEGFGIPLIESQAVGVPVITTDWTAMTELCGAGWLVQGDRFWDESQSSYQKIPYIGEIADALEEAYKHGAGLANWAREFAVRYDAERIMQEEWLPILDKVTAPREIAPLKVAA